MTGSMAKIFHAALQPEKVAELSVDRCGFGRLVRLISFRV